MGCWTMEWLYSLPRRRRAKNMGCGWDTKSMDEHVFLVVFHRDLYNGWWYNPHFQLCQFLIIPLFTLEKKPGYWELMTQDPEILWILKSSPSPGDWTSPWFFFSKKGAISANKNPTLVSASASAPRGGSKQLREVKCLRIFDASDESPELCAEYPAPQAAMTCERLGVGRGKIFPKLFWNPNIFWGKKGKSPILTTVVVIFLLRWVPGGSTKRNQPGVTSYPATPTWRIFVLQLLPQDVLQRQVMMISWSWAALKSQLSMVHLAPQHLYMIGHVWIIREPVHAEVVCPSIPCGPMLWFQHFVLSFVSVRVWTSLRWWMAWSVDVVHQL